MRWSKKVRNGLDMIYSFAEVECDAGQWSAIECVSPSRMRKLHGNDEGAFEDTGPCGKCEECRNREAMEAGIAYIGWLITKHDKGRTP